MTASYFRFDKRCRNNARIVRVEVKSIDDAVAKLDKRDKKVIVVKNGSTIFRLKNRNYVEG